MKKSLKFLLLLSILSGCSSLEFWKSDEEQKVDGPRHPPALNNSGMSGDSSMAMPSAQPSASASMGSPSSGPPMGSPSMGSPMNSPAMASAQTPMPPEPPEPPSSGTDDFMSNPAMNQPPSGPTVSVGAPSQTGGGSAAMSGATPNDRRLPQYNQQMLAQNSPSGDLVAASAMPGVSQASLPQGDLTLPPPPPSASASASASGKPDNAYPRLAEIPPAPPVPTPADQDQRVAQMKQDLADMQKQQSTYQSSGNSVSIVGGPGGPMVQDQTPRRPGNNSNQPTLIAQSPADPYLGNAQNQKIQNGAAQPSQMAQAPQSQYAPMQAQQSAPQQPTQTMNQASIMPQGPTIVVHSTNPNARPYTPQTTQMAMASPPMQQSSAYNPPPPPMMQNSMQSSMAVPPPPPVMQSSMQPPPPMMSAQSSNNSQTNSFPRAPSMQNSGGTLGGGMQESGNGQASTSLSALHPIAVEPAQTYASNSDSPASGASNPQGLQPIPTNNIRLLPASRYETMRTDARDDSGY